MNRLNDATASLHGYQSMVDKALAEWYEKEILSRIWRHDHTVWKPDPGEISNRLGWLHSPEAMLKNLPEIHAFVNEVKNDGFTQALLLGMGGSSLAPEVFRSTFGVRAGYLDLAVLDSTDPGAVLGHETRLDLTKTLFIVSTKSGGTVETLSFYKYFYNRVKRAVGEAQTGRHFVGITDAGSGLVDIARQHNFRKTFLNDPNIGGRYSALSYFGLVPAALLGVDLQRLLERASGLAGQCKTTVDGDNPGAWLGTILGELAVAGRDKLTLIASPSVSPFGAWVEQLIAESTGKEGRGILPVDGEELSLPEVYGDDRLFVLLRLERDDRQDGQVTVLKRAGHPVVHIALSDLYDLGGEFFRWEMATVIAGWRLGINPFDQPDVESAKVQARNMVAAFQREGRLPELEATLEEDGLKVYANFPAANPEGALNQFLSQANSSENLRCGRSYVAIQAYLTSSPEIDAALNSLRLRIRDRFKLAATLGYGPRFLHSTGQLHKGDAGNGLFVQITADSATDVDIPDQAGEDASSMTFGVLKMAQALGDRQALLENGRKVIRFHLSKDVMAGLKQLQRAVSGFA